MDRACFFTKTTFFLMLALIVPLGGLAQGAEGDRRIVVVGEVQGAPQALVGTLQVAGLIDGDARWVGGSATLVQTGDFLDDGAGVRKVMDLLMRLQDEAADAGGQVIVLLGNHEAMNILGELRDVNYMTYETFADGNSVARQEAAFRAYQAWLGQRTKWTGGDAPPSLHDESFRSKWLAVHPPGWVEYVEAIGPKGAYGEWLRSLPAAVRVGELLFVHGGIDPSLGIDAIGPVNRRVAEEIAEFDSAKERMVATGLVSEFASVNEMVSRLQEEIEFLNAQPPASRDRKRLETAAELQEIQSYGDWFLLAANSPLWYRAGKDDTTGAAVASVLESMGVSMMITGEKAAGGRISVADGGQLVLASTGMSDDPWVKDKPACLEIEGNVLAVLDRSGAYPLE